MPAIVYLHGFLSSPQSTKAQQTKAWLADNRANCVYHCPELSPIPAKAREAIRNVLLSITGPRYLIGSSLGGFWATWAIEQGWAEKAVLINPAVKPHRRFRLSLGETFKHFYSDECYTINTPDLDELERCSLAGLEDASKYWVMLQTEDEVLDYRFAESFYAGCKQFVEVGGDHSFFGFQNHLPDIMAFFEREKSL